MGEKKKHTYGILVGKPGKEATWKTQELMANYNESDLKEIVFDGVDGKVPGCCKVGNEPSGSI